MIAGLVLILFASPGPPTITVDLDGDGSPETVIATSHGRKIRLEVRNAAGKVLARNETPGPGSRELQIALSSGSLGGSGSLLEVSASDPRDECRTIWRLRGVELSQISVLGPRGRVSDCGRREEWSDRWEKKPEAAAADYLRERTRRIPAGLHHRLEVYRFTGFQMELDRERSTAEIDGVAIPDWRPSTLYPKALVETLFSCFDLSAFKTAARLLLRTDQDEGVFALQVEREGRSEALSIGSAASGPGKNEWTLAAGAGDRAARVHVQLAADRRTPLEVLVDGLEEAPRSLYVPVTRFTGSALEIFQTAEDQLAFQSLSGTWESRTGERLTVRALSQSPAVVEFGNERVSLSISRAPRGSDVLLVPLDGAAPRIALALRGPDGFSRVRVECPNGPASAPDACRATDPGLAFRRLGTRLNTH